MNQKKWLRYIKKLTNISMLAIVGILILTIHVFIKRNDFFDRYIYELKRPFTWDTPMYYAVGKGFSHGLKPYTDLFENKPPMIFFLASISYSLTGDYYLCNFLSFLFLLLVTLAPLIALTILFIKNKEKNVFKIILYSLSALLVGLLLGGYLQLRSGEVQVELFGSFFIIAYIFLAKLINEQKAKVYSPLVIISGLMLMIGVMFKEPFILIALACAMIICKKPKDWIYRFILPCAYGGVMAIFLLVVTGTFIPYFTVYFPHMLGNHISIYGSPFERMKQFSKLLNDMGGYSALFLGLVVATSLYVAGKIITEKNSDNRTISRVIYFISRILRVILIPLLISFTVGLGGQYYNHHYIFALPCYVLCVVITFEDLYLIKDVFCDVREESAKRIIQKIQRFALGAVCSLSIVGLLGVYLLPQPNYNHYNNILSLSKTMKEDAKYVDKVLDLIGEDTYQYFGFNGPIFYCYTEHDPQGPVFFQDPNNLQSEESFFARNLKKQMEITDVYIVSHVDCGVLTDYVKGYIQNNFVPIQSSEKRDAIKDLSKPSTFNYTIYVRKV